MKISCEFLLMFLLGSFVQTIYAQTFCGKSWSVRSTKIQERSFTLRLGKKKNDVKKIIRDYEGKPTYEFYLTSGTVRGQTGLIEWNVELFNRLGNDNVNLLKPTNDKHQDAFSAEDSPGWFYLGTESQSSNSKVLIPFLRRRTIRVDGFFCILEVLKYKRKSLSSATIESATLLVKFVNSNSDCS